MGKLKFVWVFHKNTPNKVTLTRKFDFMSLAHIRSLTNKNPLVIKFAHEKFKASQNHVAMAKPWQKRVAEALISAKYEGLGANKVFKFVSFVGEDIIIERISPLVDWDILLEIAESEIAGLLKNVQFKKNSVLKQTA